MASKKRQKPVEGTRKWYVNDLLRRIFGIVTANYDTKAEIMITNKSGLADKFEYDSPNSMRRHQNQMENLFEFAFLNSKAIYSISINGIINERARDEAIQNARKYFIESGITQFESLSVQNICIGITGYILPAIFKIDPSEECNFATNNISKRFHDAVEAFDTYLFKRSIFKSSDIDNCECYFDPAHFDETGYNQNGPITPHLHECNYAVPIKIRELYSLPLFPKATINIPMRPRIKQQDTKEKHFRKLTSGYIEISTESHRILHEDSLHLNIREFDTPPQIEIPLFTSRIDYEEAEKTVYYLTKLDQSTIEAKYRNPQTHEELHSILSKKAKGHIAAQKPERAQIVSQWCTALMEGIETVLRKAERLGEYPDYLQGNTPDDQCGNEILSIVVQNQADSEQPSIFDQMTGYSNQDAVWSIIFIKLDEATNSFFKQTGSNDEIAHSIRKTAAEQDLQKHIAAITDSIHSDRFKQMINSQKEHPPKSAPIIGTDDNPFNFGFADRSRISNLYERIRSWLDSYIEKLQDNPDRS